MASTELSGVFEWLKEGIGKFKEAIGIGQPKPLIAGTALIEAQKLLRYCQIRPIRMGDKGDIVSTLQFLLNILGFKTYTGETPDGVFGPMTYRAVVEYQKSRGLKPDGIVGRLTAFKIYQEIEEKTKVARLVPTVAQQWINKEVYKKVEDIKQKYPEFVITTEESQERVPEYTTFAPKETKQGVMDYFKNMSPMTKKYLIAGAIILAAYILSGRRQY